MAGPGRIELPVPLLESGGLPLTDGPTFELVQMQGSDEAKPSQVLISLQLFNFNMHRVLAAVPAVFLQFQLLL